MPFNSQEAINPCHGRHGNPEKSTFFERMHIFNSATKAMEGILKCRMHPGNRVQDTDALVRLRFAKGPGVEGRHNLLLRKHYAAIWLRVHIEQPIHLKAPVPRKLRWAPNFDHKPTPMWRPGAPCGFIDAAKHVVKQEAILKQEHLSALIYSTNPF